MRVDGSSLSVSVGFGVVFSRERKLKMCFLCFEGFRERKRERWEWILQWERERNKKMTDPEGGGEVAKMHLGRYVWHVSK